MGAMGSWPSAGGGASVLISTYSDASRKPRLRLGGGSAVSAGMAGAVVASKLVRRSDSVSLIRATRLKARARARSIASVVCFFFLWCAKQEKKVKTGRRGAELTLPQILGGRTKEQRKGQHNKRDSTRIKFRLPRRWRCAVARGRSGTPQPPALPTLCPPASLRSPSRARCGQGNSPAEDIKTQTCGDPPDNVQSSGHDLDEKEHGKLCQRSIIPGGRTRLELTLLGAPLLRKLATGVPGESYSQPDLRA